MRTMCTLYKAMSNTDSLKKNTLSSSYSGTLNTPQLSKMYVILSYYTNTERGLGSSVRIATDYRLDGLGSNPGGDEIFRPCRPALVPIQSPVKWVLGLSGGGKVQPRRAADHSPPSSAAVMEE